MSPSCPFTEWFWSRCMLGDMKAEVPLPTPRNTVRLLPKVCELAGTTLGARLGTVPKWWRRGQARKRAAYLAVCNPN